MTPKVVLMHAAEDQSAGKAWTDFPIRLYARHMSAILGVSLKQFYKLESRGSFVFAQHKPQVGRKTWSRDLMQAWDERRLADVRASRLRVVRG